MQATTPQNTVMQVAPKPTEAQIQAQIDNLKWQQRQNELANQWSFQNQTIQTANHHSEYMAEHFYWPAMCIALLAAVLLVIFILVRKTIAADVEKNRDDNQVDVVEAKRIVAQHEQLAEVLKGVGTTLENIAAQIERLAEAEEKA